MRGEVVTFMHLKTTRFISRPGTKAGKPAGTPCRYGVGYLKRLSVAVLDLDNDMSQMGDAFMGIILEKLGNAKVNNALFRN